MYDALLETDFGSHVSCGPSGCRLVDLISDGVVDEVWVWADPTIGSWESIMVGPDAWAVNGPSSVTHPDLTRPAVIMGWTWQMGVDNALGSFGHRTEAAIKRYVPASEWQHFMRLSEL